MRFSLRLCRNRDDAEDIVVETFTQAYLNWERFRGTGTRLNWLYGIAVKRHAMNRRKFRNRTDSIPDDLLADSTNPLDRIVIEEAIGRLPLAQLQAFLLVRSEGLTSKEAAEILGRPLGTVLRQVHQAVHLIRKEVNVKSCDSLPSASLLEAEQ